MDVEAVTAGLQPRGWCSHWTEIEVAHGSLASGGWIANLWGDSTYCLTTKAQLKKIPKPATFGWNKRRMGISED